MRENRIWRLGAATDDPEFLGSETQECPDCERSFARQEVTPSERTEVFAGISRHSLPVLTCDAELLPLTVEEWDPGAECAEVMGHS